jgi:hypothetical protein
MNYPIICLVIHSTRAGTARRNLGVTVERDIPPKGGKPSGAHEAIGLSGAAATA